VAKAVPVADKPESSLFKQLQTIWTPPGLDPGSTGVTTFYDAIKNKKKQLAGSTEKSQSFECNLFAFFGKFSINLR
jgi:hypothetical protein